METIELLWTNPLVRMAWMAGLISSIIGGIVGSFVVVKRISFVSGSISHAVLAGIGLFLWLNRTHNVSISPMYGALLVSIVCAYIISLSKHLRAREDSIISTIWAAGMAVGIIFVSKTPGYTTELSNLLIGNILYVSPQEVMMLLILGILTIAFVVWRFQQIKLLAFDPDEAFLQRVPIDRLYTQLLILVAISVVALTQVVGIVLVMTMLTLPQMLAGLFCTTLSALILWSILASVFCSTLGLCVSYAIDWPTGATIAITSVIAYLAGAAIKELLVKKPQIVR
jgi:zinc transport system permease protein